MVYSKHSKYNNHSSFVEHAAGIKVLDTFVKLGITFLSKTSFPGVFRQEEDNNRSLFVKTCFKM